MYECTIETRRIVAVVFVDTNILIYAHDVDAGDKREPAAAALERLWDEQTGRLSVQAGATHLYTEDLNAGQIIVGVKVVNPLIAA
jgi:predicted nucleic acid-binding protein